MDNIAGKITAITGADYQLTQKRALFRGHDISLVRQSLGVSKK
jgi:hypothetical protein